MRLMMGRVSLYLQETVTETLAAGKSLRHDTVIYDFQLSDDVILVRYGCPACPRMDVLKNSS